MADVVLTVLERQAWDADARAAVAPLLGLNTLHIEQCAELAAMTADCMAKERRARLNHHGEFCVSSDEA